MKRSNRLKVQTHLSTDCTSSLALQAEDRNLVGYLAKHLAQWVRDDSSRTIRGKQGSLYPAPGRSEPRPVV